MRTQTEFQNWFITFLEEKEIDMSEVTGIKGIFIGDVCTAILTTDKTEQAVIKNTLIQIDYKNGNVYHYLNHLAQALQKEGK